MSSNTPTKQLLCKWKHYTNCTKTFDLDDVEKWKEHVLEHYKNENGEIMQAALEETIPCWVTGCNITFTTEGKSDRMTKFLIMMDHVREQHFEKIPMSYDYLRNDDRSTVTFFWGQITEASEAGGGISQDKLKALQTKYVNWNPAGGCAGTPDTGAEHSNDTTKGTWYTGDPSDPRDLHPYDKRKEDREMKRQAQRAKGHGRGNGDESSRRS